MQKSSTPVKSEINNERQVEMGPKESTISLLKQFARIYTYNAALQPGLGNIIPN